MKHFFSLVFLALISHTGSAQEKHFVYIESENKQPFYVSVNGKSYSSASSGYIIIPKLAEGDYTATIGFAGNSVPEQTFRYTVGQKDLGFDLRNLGEKGWGLFNQQTLTLITGTQGGTATIVKSDNTDKNKKVEEQGPELSFERGKDPVVTPTVKADEQVVTNQTKAADSITNSLPPAAASSALTSEVASPSTAIAPSLSAQKTEVRRSSRPASNSKVKKVSEVKGDMGVYLTYEDAYDENKDTVQLIIPVDGDTKPAKKEVASKSSGSTSPAARRLNRKSDSENNNPQFLNIEGASIKDDTSTAPVATTELPAAINGSAVVNSACTNMASESDYSKLRKRMASQTTEEAKMKEARKVFKNKCFTTMQIKGLSTLFLSDAERYRFFDISYNVVTDVNAYSTLENELIDPYYVSRFKAMLKQ